ncbi:MAG: aminotransferase class IV, partial [Bryobacteraceae bacterium]
SEVWTPPISSGCLPGITRELLLGEIRVPGITLTERALFPDDLESADEVFITSTTRELLAVSMIGGRRLKNAGHTREALQTAYSVYVDEYLRSCV